MTDVDVLRRNLAFARAWRTWLLRQVDRPELTPRQRSLVDRELGVVYQLEHEIGELAAGRRDLPFDGLRA